MKLFAPNLIDVYKISHMADYPEGTTAVYSNFTARSDHYAQWLPDFDHKVVFFGLQATIKELLIETWNDSFFHRPKAEVLAQFQKRMDSMLGPGAASAERFGPLHDLGYLPILIKALPEGSRVNIRTPLFTVVNTGPRFFWLTNYIETMLSAESWKSITNATIAGEYNRLLRQYATLTGSSMDFVNWQAHDFSARGMCGVHDAAKSGMSHLLFSTGTDTVHALDAIDEYYPSAPDYFLGGSVPATEHSVMCMGGLEDEIGTFRRIMQSHPAGIVSIVSDTWDFWKVLTEYAVALKPEILSRKNDVFGNAKVVFRPDSGDPVKILCGDPDAPVGSPAFKGAVECLWDVFGGTVTSGGYRLLDRHVGLIYGDSITLDRAARILSGLALKKFASGNIVFGVGSYTYNMVTRDTFGHAYKATWGVVNGQERELFKDPITDDGMKKSLKGLIRVEKVGNDFVVFDQQTADQETQGELRKVFEDGELLIDESFQTIRRRLGAVPG